MGADIYMPSSKQLRWIDLVMYGSQLVTCYPVMTLYLTEDGSNKHYHIHVLGNIRVAFL